CLKVKMKFSPGKLQIMVCDDGKVWKEPVDKEVAKSGIGIKNMEQRTKMLNGEFQIKHTASEGTSVILSVPLEKQLAS
ncbi:MAG: hypothetical protein JST39_15330, partial [Bacteroidetes bacterium]|nr:hypothetical protein [Bacteroidota bacterium]